MSSAKLSRPISAKTTRLVEAAKLQLRPSLWNLWAFVDVLYWQLKEAGSLGPIEPFLGMKKTWLQGLWRD